jgi:hypothetical protein
MPGQFVQYNVLKDSCHSSIFQVCQSFGSSLNDTAYSASEVVAVSGESVTLEFVSIFKNGTGTHAGGLVNVATGDSNITAFSTGTRDYFVLAGGLQAPNRTWDIPSAPTLNNTVNEIVLGSPRNVNFLNYSLPGSYFGFSYKQSVRLAFDQFSGFLIYVNSTVTSNTPGLLRLDVEIGMANNNVWGNAHMPNFDLSADPTSANATGSASGNSTITLHRLYGFTATVSLSTIASAGGISCSLYPNNLPMGGSDTSMLSCKGSPGTYTVTVVGNGGYSTHNASITVAVGATPGQPASVFSMPLFYGGVGIAVAVAVLAALLFLRRRPTETAIAPSDASAPASQS